MGDAAAKPVKPEPPTSLIVSKSAHVDEAWTVKGFVSKHVPLKVSAADARRLLAAHPYLTTLGDAKDGSR